MTNLERLIAAEGLKGGTIHDYDRRLKSIELSGKSFVNMTVAEMGSHARKLLDIDMRDEARLVSAATVAHLAFARA